MRICSGKKTGPLNLLVKSGGGGISISHVIGNIAHQVVRVIATHQALDDLLS